MLERNPLPLAERLAIAERHLGALEPDSKGGWLCRCPGQSLHSTATARGHSFFKFSPVDAGERPDLACYHSSCREARAVVIREIRSQIARGERKGIGDEYERKIVFGGEVWHRKATKARLKRDDSAARVRIEAERVAREEKAARERQIEETVRAAIPRILRDHRWDESQILRDSPFALPAQCEPELDFQLWLSLYQSSDVLWIGEVNDGGQRPHQIHFRRQDEWNRFASAGEGFHFTSSATFRPGSFSRCIANVDASPWLVVEADSLVPDDPEANRNACGAVINWLRGRGLKLAMIVDAGGKSLHAWFEHPGEERLATLKMLLRALECDERLCTVSQPCRLPGVFREDRGRWQRVLWHCATRD